jgi:heme exporter protein CcmD
MLDFDKYAPYLFSSYIVTTIILVILVVSAVHFKKETIKKLKLKFMREGK